MKEKVEFERFEAKDKNGRIFNIIGYQYYVTHRPVYGDPVVLKGDIEYWTDSGLPVTKINEKTFRIFESQETITHFIEKLTSLGTRQKVTEVKAINH